MFEKALEEIRNGAPLERVLKKYNLTAEEKEILMLAYRLVAREQPRLSRSARKKILHELRKQIQPVPGSYRTRKAFVIAIALLLLTGGTFAFATSSLPSSPLYPVRNAVEKAVVRILPPGELKAKVMLWTIEKQAAQASEPQVKAEVKEKVLQTVEKRMEEYRSVRKRLQNERRIKKIEERAREKVEKLREQIENRRKSIENRPPEIRNTTQNNSDRNSGSPDEPGSKEKDRQPGGNGK